MNKTGIIIQARMSSERLPGKILKKISGIPLILHVVKRCKKTNLPVVVATSENDSDNELVELLKENKIDSFRGSLEDVMKRYIDCALNNNFENIIRVTGDNPLIDFESMDELKNIDKDYGCVSGGALGTGAEFVKTQKLIECYKECTKSEKEHVTLYIRKNIEKYDTKVILGFDKLKGLRLTVDQQEDLDLIKKIYSNMYNGTPLRNSEIYDFYKKNKEIFKLNKNVEQKKV